LELSLYVVIPGRTVGGRPATYAGIAATLGRGWGVLTGPP
jgi:hypothetical protein